MSPSTEHLLRTLASVVPGARVLDLGTGSLGDLARLGFDVWACGPGPLEDDRARLGEVMGEMEATRRVTHAKRGALGYGDATFDWVAVALTRADDAVDVLREVRRVLRPGAWVWVASEELSPEDLIRLSAEADLAVAESPVVEGDGSRGIFRRVEAGVGR